MAAPDGHRADAEYVVHGAYIAADAGPSTGSRQAMVPARWQDYVLPGGAFFDIRDGCIQRISSCSNLQEWISQVS